MNKIDRAVGCLVGLAVGDAVGTTLEFTAKGTFEPLTDMVGGGPFNLKPGEWTDDTSMALCLAQSLIHCGKFDAIDQINRYCNWADHGYMSSNGRCFDIGNTVSAALRRYKATQDPFAGSTDPRSAGNGSLMRLAPIPIFYRNNLADVIHFSGDSSRITHGALECVESCQLFGSQLYQALNGMPKEQILLDCGYQPTAPKVIAMANGEYRQQSYEDLTGSGYVIESLESALWCFDHSESFEEAILKAVNLGNDADTTGAICGQIAGAYYGVHGIPEWWVQRLVMTQEILDMAEALYHRT